MQFNSLAFIVFFASVTAVYYLFPGRLRWLVLLLASFGCYCWASPQYAGLLVANMALDFLCGLRIEGSSGVTRKFWLSLSLACNLGMLVFFKFYNLSVAHLNQIFFHGCTSGSYFFTEVVLPLGLSFHTLQAMSYTIEVYRGNQRAERHPGIYALYILFFPKLAMGPIERPGHLLPQLHQRHDFCFDDALSGLKLMVWGLFKKVVIADRLALTVNRVYETPHNYNGIVLIMTSVFYAFQIYCDFSGYTDIAIGAARVFGIRLSINFDHPFKSKSVSEFWRRWHISFSSWLRDYLFVPLSLRFRNSGIAGVALAVLATFFISGIWHGVAWKFVLWGLLHGAAIVVETLTADKREVWLRNISRSSRHFWGRAYTFSFLCLTWILFRAADLKSAWYVLSHLFSGWGRFVAPLYVRATLHNIGYENRYYGIYNLLTGVCCVAYVAHIHRRSADKTVSAFGKVEGVHWFKFYMALVLIVVVGVYEVPEFIYRNF